MFLWFTKENLTLCIQSSKMKMGAKMSWRGWLPLSLLFFRFAALAVASCPTVCVIIPKTVIIKRIPRPVPDPAAETAVIKAFLSYGFPVVDQAHPKFRRLAKPEVMEKACTSNFNSIHWIYRLSERFVAHGLVLSEATVAFLVFGILQRINKWARQLLRFYGAGLLLPIICDRGFLFGGGVC